jgi:hypothetical protein
MHLSSKPPCVLHTPLISTTFALIILIIFKIHHLFSFRNCSLEAQFSKPVLIADTVLCGGGGADKKLVYNVGLPLVFSLNFQQVVRNYEYFIAIQL